MKTLFTFFVFIFLLTTAKAQEIDVTLSATGGFSVIDFGGTPTLFRILGNGKVGIGTTNPTSKLQVEGNVDINSDLDVDDGTLHVDGTLNRVGIGTTSPLSLLDIRGTDAIMELSGHPTDKEGLAFQIYYQNVNTSSRIFFRENNTQLHGTSFIHAGLTNPVFDGTTFPLPINAFHIVTHNGTDTGSVVMTILKLNAFVGIGTKAPSAQLHTTGTVRFSNFGAGTLVTDANGNVSVSSDIRLKNIQGKFDPGLSAILQIEPINYKWKEESGLDTKNTYTGFSAQNVKEVLPEAVNNDKNGYLTLSDRPIIAALVNAIKEQQKQIEELERRISSFTLNENNKTSYGYTKTNMNK